MMKKEIFSWDRCKQEYVKNVDVDTDKIASIIKMSKVRLRFLQKQEADKETASIITEGYYDVIKELLISLLLKAGLKSANHECLISYFQTHYPQYEYETSILSELKNIRNRITYDGIFVEKSYLDKNRLEFEHIISLLLNIVNGGVDQKWKNQRI